MQNDVSCLRLSSVFKHNISLVSLLRLIVTSTPLISTSASDLTSSSVSEVSIDVEEFDPPSTASSPRSSVRSLEVAAYMNSKKSSWLTIITICPHSSEGSSLKYFYNVQYVFPLVKLHRRNFRTCPFFSEDSSPWMCDMSFPLLKAHRGCLQTFLLIHHFLYFSIDFYPCLQQWRPKAV